jgi:isocitrate lyase
MWSVCVALSRWKTRLPSVALKDLWEMVTQGAHPSFRPEKDFVNCMGALTGGQAVQQAKAGVQAIYLSGWQVAADNNSASSMYPDQSLYPVDSVPAVVKRINNSFKRADQIQWKADIKPGDAGYVDYFLPIVADAEAGFGGVLNAYELMKAMIEAGAAGVHFEDQLASVKKCGHMGGKVLVPTQEAVQKLVAARLAADVADVPTIVLARTDANAADLMTSDFDPNDKTFRPSESVLLKASTVCVTVLIRRFLVVWLMRRMLICCGVKLPSRIWKKRAFLLKRSAKYPDQLLAYNCSPSFNWKKNLDDATIAKFQRELSAMGYKYQFITLAGIHNMWYNMFELAHAYAREDMTAYVEMVQEPEFAAREKGYTFVAHQQEVGTGYFDDMTTVIQGGASSVTALTGSTEEEQFH